MFWGAIYRRGFRGDRDIYIRLIIQCTFHGPGVMLFDYTNTMSAKGTNPVIVDLHNSIMELHNWFVERNNSSYGVSHSFIKHHVILSEPDNWYGAP